MQELTKEDLSNFKKAGRIAGEARDFGKSLMKEGALVVEVLDKIEEFIVKKGAGIAFPAQMSFNTVAAHSCSVEDDDRIIEKEDVIKLDVGAHINGFIGDTALTVNLSGEYKELLNASKNALYKSFNLFRDGVSVGVIGSNIQSVITDAGFQPVRNLSGHGLGKYQIHTKPSIPNIALRESAVLHSGMTVACEPFATDGKGLIAESGEATVFSLGVLKFRFALMSYMVLNVPSQKIETAHFFEKFDMFFTTFSISLHHCKDDEDIIRSKFSFFNIRRYNISSS